MKHVSVFFRRLAHLVSGLTILIFIIFVIGEGLPTLSTLTIFEVIMFVCLTFALIGILVSWRWSLAGCILILMGYIGFVITDKQFNMVSPFSLFPIIMILYALSWFFRRLFKDPIERYEINHIRQG